MYIYIYRQGNLPQLGPQKALVYHVFFGARSFKQKYTRIQYYSIIFAPCAL